MSALEWVLQIILLIILATAIPFALRLEKAMRDIRRDKMSLDASAEVLSEAAKTAELVMRSLRSSIETTDKVVKGRITDGTSLADDLKYLIDRAEAVANRLEVLVKGARPINTEGTSPAAATNSLAAPATTAPAIGAKAADSSEATPESTTRAAVAPAPTPTVDKHTDLLRAVGRAAGPILRARS